jgi:hypothetical protein
MFGKTVSTNQIHNFEFPFNATFNNISVLLVEETTDLQQVTDKLYHIMLY